MRTFIITAAVGVFTLLSAVPSEATGRSRWAGAADLEAGAVFFELVLTEVSGTYTGSLSVFDEVSLGFDRLIHRGDVSELEVSDRRIAFRVPLGESGYWLETHRSDGLLSGQLSSGDELATVSLHRVADDQRGALGPSLLGLYEFDDGERVGITTREDGGLRMVDLHSGVTETLIRTYGNSFATQRSLLDPEGTISTVDFLVDGLRQARLIDHRDSGGPRTATRTSRLSESEIRATNGGVELVGTLLVPGEASRLRLPALILVHGSGPIYRTALYERAIRFTELGLAVAIFDKRGTGESTGDWRSASFDVLASDVTAMVEALKGRREVDSTRIGLQGHSQAGWVIALAAQASPDVTFASVVSGGPVRVDQSTLFDKENDLRRLGFGEASIAEALSLMRAIFDYVQRGEGDLEDLNRWYSAAKSEAWFEVTDLPDVPAIPDFDAAPPEMIRWGEELSFDIRDALAESRIPWLAILGSKDETCPPEMTAQAWREAMAHQPEILRLELVEGADHGLRLEDEEGTRRIAPAYFQLYEDWLRGVGVVPDP